MGKIKLIFTRTKWSPISWVIRYSLPRTRFALGLSSHCYIVSDKDSGYYYEADPFKGVRLIHNSEAITNSMLIVRELYYTVSDVDKGCLFLKEQLGKKYDFSAALGISLNPDRKWDDDSKWYCYELAAGCLSAAGRTDFTNISHVTEYALILTADKI